jgi:RNA polymerase sigma-70 factor (ECF subfamily)
MFLQGLLGDAAIDADISVSEAAELLPVEREVLSLDQRVTRYFDQWAAPVNRYLSAVFGDAAEAEEITQDTFLQLYRCLNEGQVIENVRAWLFRVAHNQAINRIKSRKFVSLLDDEHWEELRRSRRFVGPNPEQRLLQQERLERLRAAISRLPLAERQCLHLRTKGLRYREIGEILGMSTTTVAETIYRVVAKLSKESNE